MPELGPGRSCFTEDKDGKSLFVYHIVCGNCRGKAGEISERIFICTF